MPKLTDTQLVILAGAAKREDGSILPLPRKVKLEAEAAAAVFKNSDQEEAGRRAVRHGIGCQLARDLRWPARDPRHHRGGPAGDRRR